MVTATDSHAWLAGEKSRQPAQLTDENRDTSARKAGDQDTMPLTCRKEESTKVASPTLLKMNVITDEEKDTAHDSPWGNANQSMGSAEHNYVAECRTAVQDTYAMSMDGPDLLQFMVQQRCVWVSHTGSPRVRPTPR